MNTIWHTDIENDRPDVNRPFIVASRYNDNIGLERLVGTITYNTDTLIEADDKMIGEHSATSDIIGWSYIETIE